MSKSLLLGLEHIDIDIHAAWTRIRCIDMIMQHRHGYEACILTCSMYWDMQHGHEHAAWMRACSIDMDIRMDEDMQHGMNM